jgi:hypothetical protein
MAKVDALVQGFDSRPVVDTAGQVPPQSAARHFASAAEATKQSARIAADQLLPVGTLFVDLEPLTVPSNLDQRAMGTRRRPPVGARGLGRRRRRRVPEP